MRSIKSTPKESEEKPKTEKDSGSVAFTSYITGLKVRNQRFQPYVYYDEKSGEKITYGLLITDNEEVIKILRNDPNATEISAKEADNLQSIHNRASY